MQHRAFANLYNFEHFRSVGRDGTQRLQQPSLRRLRSRFPRSTNRRAVCGRFTTGPHKSMRRPVLGIEACSSLPHVNIMTAGNLREPFGPIARRIDLLAPTKNGPTAIGGLHPRHDPSWPKVYFSLQAKGSKGSSDDFRVDLE
jgi:hypothetical protein